jgi:hypothetical protein
MTYFLDGEYDHMECKHINSTKRHIKAIICGARIIYLFQSWLLVLGTNEVETIFVLA